MVLSLLILLLEFVANCVIWNLADRWNGWNGVFKTCGVFAGFSFFTGIAQIIMNVVSGQDSAGDNVET